LRLWLGALLILSSALAVVMLLQTRGERLDGFNVIVTPGHPFGSASAESALIAARRLGAKAVAIVPFLWQSHPSRADIQSGSEMSDDALRLAIRQAHDNGFTVVVKPHVWVPQSWAGAVEPQTEQDWSIWFSRYRGEILRIARIATEESAEALAIGTELTKTALRPEWPELIAAVRAVFPRTLFYVAHNVEEAEAVPFWPLLDMIGVTLYPPLGADDDREGRLKVMRATAASLDALSVRIDKPVLVAEIGLRSAEGAAAKPWESAEERTAPVASQLQADILSDWLKVLDRPAIEGILIWRWFTDPHAGGSNDTDFTVQGKPAETVLSCAWTQKCALP
jgi:hypothetical protein